MYLQRPHPQRGRVHDGQQATKSRQALAAVAGTVVTVGKGACQAVQGKVAAPCGFMKEVWANATP